MRRFIRYMATTDDSPVGALALEYLRSLLRLGPVRVGSVSGGTAGRWQAYDALLSTSMDGEFVNVVCCDPERWIWNQHITMYDRRPDGTFSVVHDSGKQELYTTGTRNVLLTADSPLLSDQVLTALRYQSVVVPDAMALMRWTELRSRDTNTDISRGWDAVPTVMIKVPVVDHASLREAVFP